MTSPTTIVTVSDWDVLNHRRDSQQLGRPQPHFKHALSVLSMPANPPTADVKSSNGSAETTSMTNQPFYDDDADVEESRRAAQPPSRRAAEPPSRRAAPRIMRMSGGCSF